MITAERHKWGDCASACAPGYLACVDDATENAELANLIVDRFEPRAWIGYTDRSNEGEWLWSGAGEGCACCKDLYRLC